jgi:hypothetical protein
VLTHRAAAVDALYAEPPPPHVLVVGGRQHAKVS